MHICSFLLETLCFSSHQILFFFNCGFFGGFVFQENLLLCQRLGCHSKHLSYQLGGVNNAEVLLKVVPESGGGAAGP